MDFVGSGPISGVRVKSGVDGVGMYGTPCSRICGSAAMPKALPSPPKPTCTLSSTRSRVTADTAPSREVWSSPITSWSLSFALASFTWTPPAALISSTASAAARRWSSPVEAAGPVIEVSRPSLIAVWAAAGGAAPSAAAARMAPSDRLVIGGDLRVPHRENNRNAGCPPAPPPGTKGLLHRQVPALQLVLPPPELGRGAREDQGALVEHQHLIRDGEGHADVLFHEQD